MDRAAPRARRQGRQPPRGQAPRGRGGRSPGPAAPRRAAGAPRRRRHRRARPLATGPGAPRPGGGAPGRLRALGDGRSAPGRRAGAGPGHGAAPARRRPPLRRGLAGPAARGVRPAPPPGGGGEAASRAAGAGAPHGPLPDRLHRPPRGGARRPHRARRLGRRRAARRRRGPPHRAAGVAARPRPWPPRPRALLRRPWPAARRRAGGTPPRRRRRRGRPARRHGRGPVGGVRGGAGVRPLAGRVAGAAGRRGARPRRLAAGRRPRRLGTGRPGRRRRAAAPRRGRAVAPGGAFRRPPGDAGGGVVVAGAAAAHRLGRRRAGGVAVTAWDELVSTALVGTERRPVPAVTVAGVVAAAPHATTAHGGLAHAEDPAALLLDRAALLAVQRRAGRVAGRAAPLPLAPAERTPPARPAAARRLVRLLAGDHHEVLPEWLDAAAAHGVRAPADLLPDLLAFGRRDRSLRAAIAAVAGRRGRWLAGLNPEWAYLLAESELGDDQPDPEAWELGTAVQRRDHLARLRDGDPAAARELLAASWSKETAADPRDLRRRPGGRPVSGRRAVPGSRPRRPRQRGPRARRRPAGAAARLGARPPHGRARPCLPARGAAAARPAPGGRAAGSLRPGDAARRRAPPPAQGDRRAGLVVGAAPGAHAAGELGRPPRRQPGRDPAPGARRVGAGGEGRLGARRGAAA